MVIRTLRYVDNLVLIQVNHNSYSHQVTVAKLLSNKFNYFNQVTLAELV